jgi:hypothetical protein
MLTTNPKWIDTDANQGLRDKKPATKRLSHGTAWVSTDPHYLGLNYMTIEETRNKL